MLSEQAKKAFSDLELPYNPVAIKFCRNRPENYQRSEGTDAFCTFLKKAQDENQALLLQKVAWETVLNSEFGSDVVR